MTGDCPEFIEAIRLTRDFFPEAKPYISLDQGFYWGNLWQALLDADAMTDFPATLAVTNLWSMLWCTSYTVPR